MCWVRGSDVETLHVGLKHALCDWKRQVTVQPSSVDALLPRPPPSPTGRQTHLPLDGHGGDVLKHHVLHLSATAGETQATVS